MDKTFFLLERFHRALDIPVYYLSPNGDVVLLNCGHQTDAQQAKNQFELHRRLVTSRGSGVKPIFQFEEGSLYSSFLDSLGNCVLLGPVPNSNMASFGAALTMLYCAMTGDMLTETQVALLTPDETDTQTGDVRFQRYLLDSAEEEKNRFTYAEELEIMELIASGNVEAISDMFSLAAMRLPQERVGKLADQPLKNFEYIVCTAIVLASRAALNSGLDGNVSYSMAEMFLQRLAKCDSFESMVHLQKDVFLGYARRMRELKKERSERSYIEKCKSYIATHINKTFTLDELSDAIGVNKFYLARQFKKEEGLSIQKYAQAKRIETACNMLKLSDEKLSNIAYYLCFNSQSHFGTVFREYMGVTPKKYREQERHLD